MFEKVQSFSRIYRSGHSDFPNETSILECDDNLLSFFIRNIKVILAKVRAYICSYVDLHFGKFKLQINNEHAYYYFKRTDIVDMLFIYVMITRRKEKMIFTANIMSGESYALQVVDAPLYAHQVTHTFQQEKLSCSYLNIGVTCRFLHLA